MPKVTNQVKKEAGTAVGLRPHLTERSSAASLDAKHPVYTFLVAPESNKALVRAAIKALYGVTPRKVNILNIRPGRVRVRGRLGKTPGKKKALVYLRAGDKIDFV
jgi:large subunit ribosomal protein L23